MSPAILASRRLEKSGKSASHIYARLSLLQLIPEVAEAFTQAQMLKHLALQKYISPSLSFRTKDARN
jgi:hypothetical protein